MHGAAAAAARGADAGGQVASERGFVADKRGGVRSAGARRRSPFRGLRSCSPPTCSRRRSWSTSATRRRVRSAIVLPWPSRPHEYGLFINGETVEGSSSRDLVEPASGEPLGTAQLAGEAEIDRAVEAARGALDGDWGKTPANERSRLLHALADALDANRKELVGARGAQRRQGDLLDQGRAPRRRRELPLLRLRDRLDRRPLEPDRRLAPLLHAERAGRRRRPDRALELPAADDDVEARARARRRLRRRAQARPADAADRAAPRRARGRGRLPGGRDQHRHRRRPDDGRLPRQASRASTRSRSPARRRRAARSCGSAPSRSSA